VLVQLVQLVHCPQPAPLLGFAEPTLVILCWFSASVGSPLPENTLIAGVGSKQAFVGSVLVQIHN
jgi:hypothetical protein